MKKYMKFLFEDVTFSRSSNSVDQQIDDVIHRAERLAVQVAMKSGKQNTEESKKSLSMKFLFEEEEEKQAPPPIDIGTFANEIIRCLMMYEKVMDVPDIIDIPGVIVSRSSDFIKTKYGEDMQKEFNDILKEDEVASKMIEDPNVSHPGGPPNQPLAVGATGGGGGAA